MTYPSGNPNPGTMREPSSSGAGIRETQHASSSPLTEKIGDVTSSAVETAKTAAKAVVENVQETASMVADKACEATSALTHKAEQAASAVTDTVAATGRYVRDSGFSGMAEDLTTIMRRYPVPTLAAGFTLGLLLSRIRRS